MLRTLYKVKCYQYSKNCPIGHANGYNYRDFYVSALGRFKIEKSVIFITPSVKTILNENVKIQNIIVSL